MEVVKCKRHGLLGKMVVLISKEAENNAQIKGGRKVKLLPEGAKWSSTE